MVINSWKLCILVWKCLLTVPEMNGLIHWFQTQNWRHKGAEVDLVSCLFLHTLNPCMEHSKTLLKDTLVSKTARCIAMLWSSQLFTATCPTSCTLSLWPSLQTAMLCPSSLLGKCIQEHLWIGLQLSDESDRHFSSLGSLCLYLLLRDTAVILWTCINLKH